MVGSQRGPGQVVVSCTNDDCFFRPLPTNLISTRPTERRPAAGCEAERVAGVALPFYNGNIKSAHGDVVGKARLSNACMCTVQA
jgi:hypothetical protein